MRIQYQSIEALKRAIKSSRQLTFGEQAQANELLDEVRREALHFYKTPAACTKPDKPEEYSRAELLLMHHRLHEVYTYAQDNMPGLDGAERASLPEGLSLLVMALCREAAHGYTVAAHHDSHRTTAPAVMHHVGAPAKPLPKEAEATLQYLAARVEDLESRLAAVESALLSEQPSVSDGQPPTESAQKEGAT